VLKVDEQYVTHKFDADSVFNTDETNNPTVVEPAKVIAQKGTHQVLFLVQFVFLF